MNRDKQVWFFEGSPAATLGKSLKDLYVLKTLRPPAKSKAAGVSFPAKDGAAVVCLADMEKDDLDSLRDLAMLDPKVRLIGVLDPDEKKSDSLEEATAVVFACLPRKTGRTVLEKTVAAAFANIDLAAKERGAREDLERAQREMEELNRIGVALSSQRDINSLLNLILLKSREITRADAASIYLVEELTETEGRLRFKLTQNDSFQFPFTESTIPVTEKSMAGYAALRGVVINLPDAYKIPPACPYQFNPKYDQDSGYLTRSVLTLPMKNAKDEVLGVLQLINCKRDFKAKLLTKEIVDREVEAFSPHSQRLALSLASQAAVAYENSKLYEDIETLFEGFVKAAVTAIEQRDPTTSGHSFRVSTLTVGLAETVDRVEAGPYSNMNFSREQMKEIRYAALLHDFGKVGVREEVLVKAKKLYPLQLSLVQQRFDYIRKEVEERVSRQKLQYLLEKSREEALTEIGRLDQEAERQLTEIDDYMQFVLQVNEPTVLPEGKFDHLIDIAKRSYRDPRGIEHQFLNPDEVRFLSIPKGSLDAGERTEIESHVVHTFNFLTQIPWTKEIRDIPSIARAHHEKLNGLGYPYKLKSPEIPFQSKMMTICDIFDALSATDRPYKKALPVEKALNILQMSVKDSEIDPDLMNLFLDAKIYQLTIKR
ncbi:MAG: GAF domain-containing protein [Acidobacteria bacterium]|nr:GAF domain-containing protein [Acidobacteriota bacterium]